MRSYVLFVASCLVATSALAEEPSYSNPDVGAMPVSFDSYFHDSNCQGCTSNDCYECNNACRERHYLFPQSDSGFNVYGWMDAGFIGNTSSPSSKFNGPYNSVDRSNEAMFNQLYIVGEKSLPKCGTGFGARIDYLYGEDYLLAESAGLERDPDGAPRWNPEYYGSAFPQAFASVGNQDLSLQVGHFYSVVGYEGVMSPGNFFYSKSYSYQFAGPFTHWGGQVNWNIDDAWTVQAGLTNGWDALDRTSDSVGFVGKIKYTDVDSGFWTSFAIVTGKEFNNLAGLNIQPEFTNRTRYSWLVGVPINCKTEYIFHHWLGVQEDGAPDGDRADWYGIDQYLLYTISQSWQAGLRFEWFRDEDGTRIGLNRPSNPNTAPFPGNVYSLSAGVNWKPTENLVIRPEIRSDWYDGSSARQPYDDGVDGDQLMLGVDAILLF